MSQDPATQGEDQTAQEQPSKRWFMRVLAAVGALGVLTWAAPYYGPGIAKSTWNTWNSLRKTPLIEWTVSPSPGGRRMTALPISKVGPKQVVCDKDSEDASIRTGFIEADSNRIFVTIEVLRDVVVHFSQVDARVVSTKPPVKGIELNCMGSLNAAVTVKIDLDTRPPTVGYYRLGDDKPRNQLLEKLEQGDKLSIDVQARTKKNLVTWQGEIPLLIDGEEYTIPLTNKDHPFSVTPGPESRLSSKLIKRRYEWTGEAWEGYK
jgi:hypothetical protein